MKKLKYMSTIIFVLVIGCNGKPAPKKEPKSNNSVNEVTLNSDELKNAGLVTDNGIDSLVSFEKELNGMIDIPPQNNVCISFPMGGYLKTTKLIPGMKISKGENIATMEDPAFVQLQQDYLIAVSQLDLKEAEYLRQKDLNASKTSSDKTFQLAKADFESARITRKALGEKLEILGISPYKLTFENISKYVSIRSPVNGVVSKVNVNIGKYISPSDVMFEIIDGSDIHLKLTAFENDAGNFKVGDEVVAYTNYNNEKKYYAKIISISPAMNENSRSFEIHCHFNEKYTDLIPGTYMNAKVISGNMDALLFPENALVSWHEKDYLFIDKGNSTYEMFVVEVNYTSNGLIGIDKTKYIDLTKKKVVVKNSHYLLMKLKNTTEEE